MGQTMMLSNSSDGSGAKKIRIDPNSAVAETENNLFDSIRYVILETTKESEFSRISELRVTDDRYIILDNQLDIIILFDKNGKFIHKIAPNEKGGIPGSIMQNFTVNEVDKTIHHYSLFSHMAYFYDFDGKLLRKEKQDYLRAPLCYINNLEVRYNNYYKYINTTSPSENDLFPNIEVFDRKSGARLNGYLHFDKSLMGYKKELISTPKYFYNSNASIVLFIQPYDNVIYQLTDKGQPKAKYQLVFPLDNALPIDFLTNAKYDGQRMKFVQDRNPSPHNQNVTPLFYKIENTYEVYDWLTVKLTGFRSLLYHTKTGELYDLSRTEFTNWGFSNTKPLVNILAVDKNALLSSVDFRSIVKYYSDNSVDNRLAIADLKKFLKKDFHNPILQLSYLKK